MAKTHNAMHALRHAAVGNVPRANRASPPPVEAQCRAVVARLTNVTGIGDASGGQVPSPVDDRAVEALSDPTNWGGRAIMPWGHPHAGGMLSRDIVPVRAGRSGWYLQHGDALYDTMRDVFAAARLGRPVSAPWSTTRQVHRCGCLTVATARRVAVEDTVDVEAQLELMRAALKHIALAAPEIKMNVLADDLFGGQRVLAEHYLWRLEIDGFVDHAHDERQSSLMLSREGCSVLLMLELTKPGTNEDALSPLTLAEIAAEAPSPHLIEFTAPEHVDRLDVPRFLERA